MGQERLLEDLRKELAQGEVLVVVGTGVSIQATGGAKFAKWDELILDGIAHAQGTNLLKDAEAERLRQQLEGGTVDDRLDVAEEVEKALGREFRLWLHKTVGALGVKDASVIDAVHGLGAPIATTNYDDLLTRGRSVRHVPWTNVAAAQEILRGHRRDAVLHLHGSFDDPDSVVLGRQSYQKLLASSGAQGVQQGLAATKALLFIGCGDGLTDPNLGHLLDWVDEAFGDSVYRHYRLCRTAEQKAPKGRLFDVAYGDDFDDLVRFLCSIAPLRTTFSLPPAGYCFGREPEVEEVVTALLVDDPQPLPILGGPGMGKTTIALTALHDDGVAERFRERRWFVRCDGVKTRAELAAAIARTLGLPVTSNVESEVLAALAARPTALVLDNGETPLDADGAQVEELLSVLATIDSLAVAVTIRGHRRPPGVPWRATTEPDRLADGPSTEAFVAASGKPQFANDPYLPRLLAVLDGVPLAITLMAHFAEIFGTLEPVWSRWEKQRTAMLRDGDTRLTNLRVSYELSIGVLSPAAKRLLSVLAMLPDGVAYRDLEGVFADPDEAADELRRRALVFDEGQRLRMRAPLREHVAAEHAPDPDDRRRMVDHYLALAAREGRKVGWPGGADAVARLAPEVATVEAMFGQNIVKDDGVGDAVYGWARLMRFTGLGSTGPLEQIAVHAVASGLTPLAARSFASLGHIALDRSNHETARAHYDEALPLYRQMGAVLGEANCILRLGDIARERSNHETARAHYEEALSLFREVSDVLGEANCIEGLGDIAVEHADYVTARARYEEALRLFRRLGDILSEANCILWLGEIARMSLDHETARARYEEALPLYQQVGSVLGEANCIQSLGDIAFAEGDCDGAESHYRTALKLYERRAEPYSIGRTYQRLARLAVEDASRAAHVAAARAAWKSIKRDDLVADLDAEFGTG